MTQRIYILGRQPGLGLAELERQYGAPAVQPWGTHAALVDAPEAIPFTQLGGSTRECTVLTRIPSTDWRLITETLRKLALDTAADIYEGKIRLGISHIGTGVSPRVINATGLELKKSLKAAGHSVRVVPNTHTELNTAQILHNQLTGPSGIELVIAKSGASTVIARTTNSQNITAYAARDQKRPKRDARVGMLPPKLAQIIINLSHTRTPGTNSIVLDPFCGTGVVLQEALLMGCRAYGTDLEPRMIEYSGVNLQWLTGQAYHGLSPDNFKLAEGDATQYTWESFDTVACETYLGRALNAVPAPQILQKIIADCDTIHRKFLQNLADQTAPGFQACIAVPAWRKATGGANDFWHLKTLDNLSQLGYNRIRFVHVRPEDLIYHRPDQVVGRELVVLERV